MASSGHHRRAAAGMARTVVIGTSACGKTTLAARLARKLGCEHIELDQLNWLPGWQTRPLAEFRGLVAQAAAGERWVIDGNYGRVRDLVWPRATHVVWLNYSFALAFSRALRRTTRRVITGQALHGGNGETLAGVLFDPEAIPYWVIRTYRRRRRQYRQLLRQPEYRHLEAHEFRNPAAAEAWLAVIEDPLTAR